MEKTFRIIGDVHGKFGRYRELIRGVPASIQVGDMGVGFRARHASGDIRWLSNPPYDAMTEGDHFFIRGNHDNPDVCKRHNFCIPDGSVIGTVFLLGGATSIDRAFRTEGLDWWPDEECSYADLQRHIETYEAAKPDVVITHEAPQSVANEILATFNMRKIEDRSRTREALEQMFYIHKPRLWFFGHWHVSVRFEMEGTTFQCLNELEYVDVELDVKE